MLSMYNINLTGKIIDDGGFPCFLVYNGWVYCVLNNETIRPIQRRRSWLCMLEQIVGLSHYAD